MALTRITPKQREILLRLLGGWQPHPVSCGRLCQRLVRKGFVRLHYSPDARPSFFVTITDEGRARVSRAHAREQRRQALREAA